MSIPRYSRTGFAGVARITAAKYTVFVEGKNHDAVYYERLLTSHPEISNAGVRIIRSSEISDEPVSTGGKSAVLSHFEFFKNTNHLTLKTNSQLKHMVFFLDRDFDEFSGKLHDNPHIIYTHAPDVEAEIYRQGDLKKALATVFSLTSEESDAAFALASNYAFELALRWRAWLTLCIASEPLRSRCQVTPSRPSQINEHLYGAYDSAAYSSHYQALIQTAVVEDPEQQFAVISGMVDSVYESAKYFRLLKGKLIPGFIIHLISPVYAVNERDVKARSMQLTLVMLDNINFEHQASYHYGRLGLLDPR
ncbi:DUF4435 domain-containing protein [Pseudarthrobacter sp. GA104]|uniref:DUF4435 domain-containing protein n=1 Tax=Pseudarthrobacter sp. GA104 TaxID=2676311 RepID=UPI0012F7DE39|nr:DUF4435 domain-containing protein [Pseudarthrobacter sp. GA104]MUU72045.1 DUF4435 domain-containing protein [Pseudarthrobacter sp. GA104]